MRIPGGSSTTASMVPTAGRRRGSVFLRGIGPTRTEPTTTRSPIFSPRAANCSATVRFGAFALTCSTNHRVFSYPSTACVNATCIALPGFSSRPLSAVTKRGLSGIAALTVHHRLLRRSSTTNRPASSLMVSVNFIALVIDRPFLSDFVPRSPRTGTLVEAAWIARTVPHPGGSHRRSW